MRIMRAPPVPPSDGIGPHGAARGIPPRAHTPRAAYLGHRELPSGLARAVLTEEDPHTLALRDVVGMNQLHRLNIQACRSRRLVGPKVALAPRAEPVRLRIGPGIVIKKDATLRVRQTVPPPRE